MTDTELEEIEKRVSSALSPADKAAGASKSGAAQTEYRRDFRPVPPALPLVTKDRLAEDVRALLAEVRQLRATCRRAFDLMQEPVQEHEVYAHNKRIEDVLMGGIIR